ncbi:TRAP transporter large permease [Kribbia dieselivorans]|uniref:TRAP transporter large permease n=1 Tax=Kribbia dieselivorans TaxID=331526 RepID=UPI00083852BB|nr:TRAP transporter large permease [Kribbia dieselivorans]
MIALLIILLLLVLILLRVPVSFAVLTAGALGLWLVAGTPTLDGVMQTAPATAVMSYSLSAVPLFILMAQLILLSGYLDSLFDAARALVGQVRGGTASASVAAGTAFAAVSGSSTASAATLAQTSTVQMIREGYSTRTAGGLVAVVGTLAAMIPPSIILVFYAITAEVSVGTQLVSGFFPGILIAIVIIATMYAGLLRNPDAAPAGQSSTWTEKRQAVVEAAPLLIVFIMVVGSIYAGIATPTEAAALGCLAAFVLVAIKRRVSASGLTHAVVETVQSTAMIFAMIVGAHVFGHFLTETRVTPKLVAWVGDLAVPGLVIMLCVAAVYVVLGFFMDQIAIIALTVPVVLPLVESLGYDPIWFGVFVVMLAEVGMVTPPMGLNVFVVSRSAKLPLHDVFVGAFPYVVSILLLAVVFLLFPQIVLFIPESM